MPRKPSVEESEDGGQQPRMGFSDEECCVPKFCKNFLCPLAKNKMLWLEDLEMGVKGLAA